MIERPLGSPSLRACGRRGRRRRASSSRPWHWHRGFRPRPRAASGGRVTVTVATVPRRGGPAGAVRNPGRRAGHYRTSPYLYQLQVESSGQTPKSPARRPRGCHGASGPADSDAHDRHRPRSRETEEHLMLKGRELYPRNLSGIIVIIVRGNRDRWTNVASAGIVGEVLNCRWCGILPLATMLD
jgi:hypothetical protein